jgi:hypothetical protein
MATQFRGGLGKGVLNALHKPKKSLNRMGLELRTVDRYTGTSLPTFRPSHSLATLFQLTSHSRCDLIFEEPAPLRLLDFVTEHPGSS